MQILRTTAHVDIHGRAQLEIIVLEGDRRTAMKAIFASKEQLLELAEKLRLVSEYMP